MQAPLQLLDLKELHQSLEEELERLKSLALKVERAAGAARVSEMIQKARRSQMDSDWLTELRAQYNEETCQSTLRANRTLPIAEE